MSLIPLLSLGAICCFAMMLRGVSYQRLIFITPVLMLVYLLFDYIRCQFTGKFVYGFAEPDVLTFPYAVLIGIAVYIIMMLFSFCLLKVNKVIHR